MINWRELYNKGKAVLEATGIDDAGFDAYQLILSFFNGSATEYTLHMTDFVSDEMVTEYMQLIDRRRSGEPLQYILGKWDFYESSFFVGKGVLIPRPETEELVSFCIDIIKKNRFSVVYDLCTGSGCIGLSIAKACPDVTCYLFELYDEAFFYAEKNLSHSGLSNVILIKHNVLECYNEDIPNADIIVSNPPYIESSEIPCLQSEVLQEPVTALDGGNDGLDFYRVFFEEWSAKLNSFGYFAFECAENQTEKISQLAGEAYLSDQKKDIYGNFRFVISKKLLQEV